MTEITSAGGPNRRSRRPRPNTYTTNACERCRTRKQRCLTESDQQEICKNCAESGSACVFLQKPERNKRSRHDRHDFLDRSSFEPDDDPRTAADDLSTPSMTAPRPQRPIISQPSLLNADIFLTEPPSKATPSDWTSWNTIPSAQSDNTREASSAPAQYDWNAFMATFATQAAKYINQESAMPNTVPQHAPLATPGPSTIPTSQPSGVLPPITPNLGRSEAAAPMTSPDENADPHSIFETAKGLAMISLEAAAEPHYIGESSASLWSTVVSKGLNAPRAGRQSKEASKRRTRTPSPAKLTALRSQLAKPLSHHTSALVLETVYRHLHSRYAFMDWPAFEIIWAARDQILLAVAQNRIHDKEAGVASFFVLMLLAIGAQYCRSQHPPDMLRAYDYYLLAQPYLKWIVQLHNLANVQGLLLLAIYSLRDTRGPSIWYISGVTMRLCIGLGLHRARTPRNVSPHTAEVRKRIFWTCYTLDRMVSLLLGRPPGISDDDIDADLPSIEIEPDGSCPLASAVHYIKLKQLESKIQRAVFTIGSGRSVTTDEVDSILQAVDQWESEIPAESSTLEHMSVPCCSRDWFLLRAVETRLHLLRPLCQENSQMAQTLLPRLAVHAAQGCELQKQTHFKGAPSSDTQLHSTFICGLAMLYAVFLQPSALPLNQLFSAIKAASNTLFAYANTSPSAGPLYEVFEELSGVCIDRVSQGVPAVQETTSEDWQAATHNAATHLGSDSEIEYADLFRSLGLEMQNEPATLPDGLWDVSTFFPSQSQFVQ